MLYLVFNEGMFFTGDADYESTSFLPVIAAQYRYLIPLSRFISDLLS